MKSNWIDKIFNLKPSNFEALAIEIFHFQYENNMVYRNYVQALKIKSNKIKKLTQIPFLPISLFKSHKIVTTEFIPEIMFESSGTTTSVNSKHFIKNVEIYTHSFLKCFEQFYGDVKQWQFFFLLPNYLERQNSSLVYMANKLIEINEQKVKGFYLYDHENLYAALKLAEAMQKKTLLLGVSYALLDFVEKFAMPLKNTIVMETGGMKGRKDEYVREKVHNIIEKNFFISATHSEYGMTELLSQAYSQKNGVFHSPPWMKALVRSEDDPLQVNFNGHGILNIIDLANIYSCAFIATDDVGFVFKDGGFEINGRLDNSDLRGCSLMVSQI